ncbi:MAG: glycosyltransferase, partial [Myxococcaceae bacterium]
TEALVGPRGPGVELVGPSLGGVRSGECPPATFGGGRPVVYVSFGSQAWYQPQRYDRVLEAADALELAVFAAMGELAEGYQGRSLPDHVRCVSFAAQLEVLERASVLITHGGANSVMEGLSRGVPLLVAPICNDQPHNRFFVEQAGAGRGIDLDRCSHEELVAALRALIADGPERANARRISQSYQSRPGSRGAASMTLRAISR